MFEDVEILREMINKYVETNNYEIAACIKELKKKIKKEADKQFSKDILNNIKKR